MNKTCAQPLARCPITGRQTTRSPVDNRAPTRRSARAAFLVRNAVNGAPNMSICALVRLVGTAGRFPANLP